MQSLAEHSRSQMIFGVFVLNVVYVTSASAKKVMSVCLSVCLLATSRKNYWPDLHENFTRDVHVRLDKEE